MENYYNISWLEQDKLHKTTILKRLFYFFSRPLLSIYASQFLSPQTLKMLQPSLVLPRCGMSLEDLFSRLSSKEYCELFQEVGFQIKDLILQLDPKSLAFKTEFSEIFRQLCDKHTNKYEDDFLISANLFRLLKPSSS